MAYTSKKLSKLQLKRLSDTVYDVYGMIDDMIINYDKYNDESKYLTDITYCIEKLKHVNTKLRSCFTKKYVMTDEDRERRSNNMKAIRNKRNININKTK